MDPMSFKSTTNHSYSLTYDFNSLPRRSIWTRRWNLMPRMQRNLLTATVCLVCLSLFFYFIILQRDLPNVPDLSIVSNSIELEELVKVNVDIINQSVLKPIVFKGPSTSRQAAVVDAFRHAWAGYKKYAWGHDHLLPVSGSYEDWMNLGLTIVDSLDTMIIMNLLEEFNESRQWIESELNFNQEIDVNFFEATIRVLGGLLSAYHLNNRDPLFLEKAVDIGKRLASGFKTPTGLPYSDVDLFGSRPKKAQWNPDSSLAEVGTVQLEFRELSRLVNYPDFENLAFNVSVHIHKLGCLDFDGLCPMFINPDTGSWRRGTTITMGARSDTYYEYLLKQWLQTGKRIDWLLNDYLQSIKGIQKHLLRYSQPSQLAFVGELLHEKNYSPKMDHLVCFLPGTLALGYWHRAKGTKLHLTLAKKLAETCRHMHMATRSKLAPEIAYFNLKQRQRTTQTDEDVGKTDLEDMFIKNLDAHSLLRPEAAESWFYLYRVTGDKKYQEWGWELFQAIEKHAKVENGYTSIHNIKSIPVVQRDKMESFFLAETLKYLYLLFDNDQKTVLPLNKWIFNSEAHPLPIRNG